MTARDRDLDNVLIQSRMYCLRDCGVRDVRVAAEGMIELLDHLALRPLLAGRVHSRLNEYGPLYPWKNASDSPADALSNLRNWISAYNGEVYRARQFDYVMHPIVQELEMMTRAEAELCSPSTAGAWGAW